MFSISVLGFKASFVHYKWWAFILAVTAYIYCNVCLQAWRGERDGKRGREGEKERESGVGLSVRHFGNLCSCGPVWRWWLTWPGLRAAASGWFPRIITLIGSIRAAVHWFVSTFLLWLTWISPCFLPLLRSDRRLQVFSYSALRQSGLAICNFGVPHCAFVWRSGLIHCWDSSFFNVTASLCGKEQIPIQRDGAGLSELTAEWTRWFGNCLLVSYDLFK